MPNYIYKCKVCEDIMEITLPISTDPSQCIENPDRRHGGICYGLYKRIIGSTPSFKGLKTFAGDWYKKTYGIELGQGSLDKAQQAEDRKTLEREFRKRTGQ